MELIVMRPQNLVTLPSKRVHNIRSVLLIMLNVSQDKLRINYFALFISPLFFISIIVILIEMKIDEYSLKFKLNILLSFLWGSEP